jgi:hypothetical protein
MIMLGLVIGLLVISFARNPAGNGAINPRTIHALAQAREALLGYSTTYRDTHPGEAFGYLPCPDLGSGTEGQAATACGGTDVTVIGRLPWKTLDLPPLRDASGECLWYAISGNYKNNPKTSDLLNRDTNGLIEVMAADGTGFIAGAVPTQRAVAVVFAPGAILPGQDRSLAATNPPTVCGGNYGPANYLDSDAASSIDNATASNVANALTRFIAAQHSDLTTAANDIFNDQLMTIATDDVFSRHIDRRADFESYLTDPITGLMRKSADCLAAYGRSNDSGVTAKVLPWTTQMNVGTFGNSASYDDSAGRLSGHLPWIVDTSATTAPNTNSNYPGIPMFDESRCAGWTGVSAFWENWKDHLYYAVARAHRPDSAVAIDDDPCILEECISVADSGGIRNNMAAVILFSGSRMPTRSRNNDANPAYTSADKAEPANFLDGINLFTIRTNPGPAVTSDRLFSKLSGNDTIMCLRPLPVGTGTELFVDPTCGASASCTVDGSLLAAYRTGATNNCRAGTSGVSAACTSLMRNIDINNCPGDGTTFIDGDPTRPYSCERGARDFVSFDCLEGFSTPRCQLAYTALTKCQ